MALFPLVSSSLLARSMLPLFRYPQFLDIRYNSVANVEDNKGTSDVKMMRKPRSVSVRVAHELLQAGHRYLDVRTSDEFNAGHPSAAINIPYYHMTSLRMAVKAATLKNSKFLEEVSLEFEKEEKILVGCKLGRRSLMAAADLQVAGFTHVIDVAGGYTAWKENGLPITE